MNQSKWLGIIGGIILFFGLTCALWSNHYEVKVMGNAALGIAVIGPNKDSPAWKEKIQTRQLADRFFYLGIFLTAIGISLQTWGSIISKPDNKLKAFIQKKDWTKFWILIILAITCGLVILFYLFQDTDYLTISQVATLAITAIAIFFYAKDTNRQLQILEEGRYQPSARFSVLQKK